MFVDFFTGLKTLSDGRTFNFTNRTLIEADEFSIEIKDGSLGYYINNEFLGTAFESLILKEGGLKVFLKLNGTYEKIGIMHGYNQ